MRGHALESANWTRPIAVGLLAVALLGVSVRFYEVQDPQTSTSDAALIASGFNVTYRYLDEATKVDGDHASASVSSGLVPTGRVLFGPARVAVKAGSLIHVAAGGAYLLLDVQTAPTPNLISVSYVDGLIRDMEVRGTLTYLIGEMLWILDTSIPARPVVLSQTPMPEAFAFGIDVSGDFAFLANDLGSIVDISEPLTPVFVGQIFSQGSVGQPGFNDIAVLADTVFLAHPGSFDYPNLGVGIADVSEKTNSKVVDFEVLPAGYPLRLAVGDSVIYVSGGDSARIFGWSSTLDLIALGSFAGTSISVAVADSILLLSRPPDVEYYSLSDPLDPQLLGAIADVTGNLAATGDTLLVASGSTGFKLFAGGFDHPPQLVSSLPTGGAIGRVWVMDELVLAQERSNYAYRGLHLVDASTVGDPREIAFVKDEYADDLEVGDDHLYVVSALNAQSGTPGSLRIYDIVDRSTPQLVSELDIPGRAVEVAGQRLYVLGEDGLIVLSLLWPQEPKSVVEYRLDCGKELEVEAQLAFVACGSEGLIILDLSDASNIRELGRWSDASDAYDLIVDGTWVYLMDTNVPGAVNIPGFHRLDVSDPSAPVRVDSVHFGVLPPTGFALSRGNVLVAGLLERLASVSVNNGPPENQGTIYRIDGYRAWDVAASAHLVALAYGEGGVHILRWMPVASDERPEYESGFRIEVYPNPASSLPSIQYTMGKGAHATWQIFDLLGRTVATHDAGLRQHGRHDVSVNEFTFYRQMAPGVYVLRLDIPGRRFVRTFVLLN